MANKMTRDKALKMAKNYDLQLFRVNNSPTIATMDKEVLINHYTGERDRHNKLAAELSKQTTLNLNK